MLGMEGDENSSSAVRPSSSSRMGAVAPPGGEPRGELPSQSTENTTTFKYAKITVSPRNHGRFFDERWVFNGCRAMKIHYIGFLMLDVD